MRHSMRDKLVHYCSKKVVRLGCTLRHSAYTALKACETKFRPNCECDVKLVISVVNIGCRELISRFIAKLVTTCEIAPQLIFRPHMIRILRGHVSPIKTDPGRPFKVVVLLC